MTMPARRPSADHGADGGNAVLNQLRNMWQFANLCQWIYIFGKAIRLDDSIDIEVSIFSMEFVTGPTAL